MHEVLKIIEGMFVWWLVFNCMCVCVCVGGGVRGGVCVCVIGVLVELTLTHESVSPAYSPTIEVSLIQ